MYVHNFFQFAIVLVVKLVVLPRACETLPMLAQIGLLSSSSGGRSSAVKISRSSRVFWRRRQKITNRMMNSTRAMARKVNTNHAAALWGGREVEMRPWSGSIYKPEETYLSWVHPTVEFYTIVIGNFQVTAGQK